MQSSFICDEYFAQSFISKENRAKNFQPLTSNCIPKIIPQVVVCPRIDVKTLNACTIAVVDPHSIVVLFIY